MNSTTRNRIFEEIAATIEIPDSAYELAEKRYQDLGTWFGRRESICSAFDPHVHAQGSFRLGTVVRPLDENAGYDLDLSCNLRKGIHKNDHTQEQLKSLVGLDVESYRLARRIEKAKAEKHRCWRLEYADDLSFHMDIVPCIPEGSDRRLLIEQAMVKRGVVAEVAQGLANLTVSITDDRHASYRSLSSAWYISNPMGYALWFESRMKLAAALLEKRMLEERVARVDDLPVFRWKSPLQRCVQVLKRHRDVTFIDNPESKPISIIVTTLAARAYRGETNLGDAMQGILYNMAGLISPEVPKVPNPVDPSEDFADKWDRPQGLAMRLEENFKLWLEQAISDFETIGSSNDTKFISEQALQRFSSRMNPSDLREKLGVAAPWVSVSPKSHRINEPPARPWRR